MATREGERPEDDVPVASRETLALVTWSDGEAALVHNLLEQYGIPSRVASDFPHTLLPVSVDGLGEIRVYVPSDRYEEAVELLAEHRREGLGIAEPGDRDA
jgi:putative signal transducing protein